MADRKQARPYTTDGDVVIESAAVTVSATVMASHQHSERDLVVDCGELFEGGFVTVHDSSLLEGAVFDSIRTTSDTVGRDSFKL